MGDALLLRVADGAARGIEVAGVAAIVAGIVWALARGLARRRRSGAFIELRSSIGRAILLGPELLVAADIIATITAPQTAETVGLLAAIILIRTFLSVSLETEIEGRWPWRRRDDARANADPSARAPASYNEFLKGEA
ncbi:MAG: DUF1622 domain-containing protein [Parvularculaceae bacterium]|nr:DUF1622 domain-containing protein [Parvularculaceae bacterium]